MAAIIFVDRDQYSLGTRVIKGAADMLHLPLRDILDEGARIGACQILMIHTHPSGDPRPSEKDIAATRLFCTQLRRQRQRLIDHIILSRTLYFSFRANHML